MKNKKDMGDKIYNKQFFIFPTVSVILLFSSLLCALTDDVDIALFTAILSVLIAIGILWLPSSHQI